MIKKFKIKANAYLRKDIIGFYHTDYVGFNKPGNPDYLNILKNDFNNNSKEELERAQAQLYKVLKNDLNYFSRKLTICVVPRSKAEKKYSLNQLLFKETVKKVANELNFKDGTNYIIRHTDTKTTHMTHSVRGKEWAGEGSMPYLGITKDTCILSDEIIGKEILLIDDIYTFGINIDEDAIDALLDKGAKSVIFYAIGKTVKKF